MTTRDTILEIYERAADAWSRASEEELDAVLNPFIEELERVLYDIQPHERPDILEAKDLDDHYFGFRGSYWIHAFNNPRCGEIINHTYDFGTETQDVTFLVLEKGLLTMNMAILDGGDSEESEEY